MQSKYSGRLELTWTNKGQTLLAHDDHSYEWVDPADYRVSEVRLLHDVMTVGDTATVSRRATDNLLIRGDALHALNALNRIPEFAREYVGRVRLIYVDPPFNTGQVFPQYDDALEHSVWLTMMRDRLVQLRDLLTPDGSVWVHLDDAEVHRCRAVLDEVFGADNFVATVVWQKLHARNNSAQHLSTDHDLILIYAKYKSQWHRNRLGRTEASDSDFWNPDDDPRGRWRRSDLTASHAYAEGKYEVIGPHGDPFTPRDNRWWSLSKATFDALAADNRIWWGKSRRSFPFRKRFEDELPGLVPTTVWPDDEVGNNREAKQEITRLFGRSAIFGTPKPERLLHRIIHIATNPGDIILDCYAGSGTTAAVAHKMGRRWVTIEWSADTVATFALPRLEKVVNNEDTGGVTSIEVPVGDALPDAVKPRAVKDAAKVLAALFKTGLLDHIDGLDDDVRTALIKAMRDLARTKKEVLWSGGGGFRVLDVGPSMFEEIDGRIYLADWAVNGALNEAVAAQFGYSYAPDGPFCGTKGKTRLAVVDGLVNEGVIRLLADVLPEGEKMLVCGTAIDPECRAILKDLRPGSTMRKVPAAILDDYRVRRRDRLALASVLDWSEGSRLIDASVVTIGSEEMPVR